MSHAPLTPERRDHADAIIAWILGDARQITDPNDILSGLCERMIEGGVPVDRATSAIQVLNAENLAVARVWERGSGAHETILAYGAEEAQILAKTPFRAAHDSGEWVNLWIPDTPDETFSVVPDLRAGGFRHYVCIPVTFINGMENAFSVVTKSRDGFSEEDFALITRTMPALVALTRSCPSPSAGRHPPCS